MHALRFFVFLSLVHVMLSFVFYHQSSDITKIHKEKTRFEQHVMRESERTIDLLVVLSTSCLIDYILVLSTSITVISLHNFEAVLYF